MDVYNDDHDKIAMLIQGESLFSSQLLLLNASIIFALFVRCSRVRNGSRICFPWRTRKCAATHCKQWRGSVLLERDHSGTEVQDNAGEYQFRRTHWSVSKINVIFTFLLLQVLDKYFEKLGFVGPITDTFDSRREDIIKLLEGYDSPPFTAQRLAEILLDPFSQYRSTHKLMNALEKLLLVSSADV